MNYRKLHLLGRILQIGSRVHVQLKSGLPDKDELTKGVYVYTCVRFSLLGDNEGDKKREGGWNLFLSLSPIALAAHEWGKRFSFV